MRDFMYSAGALFLGAALASIAPANAQTAIGGALVAKNDVSGLTRGETLRVAEGDRVYQNEVVRTGADSLAKLVLLDDTNVMVGPLSRITLDKFVYDPDAGAKKVLMNAATGAFRFMSGRAPHEAYEVRTPQAILGVRGTIYDVRVERGRTRVVLQEGAVNVCRIDRTFCIDLTAPGQSVEVTDNGINGPIAPAGKTWDFGSLCGGTIDPCNRVTQFALNDLKPAAPASATPIRLTRRAEAPARRPARMQRVEIEPVTVEPARPRQQRRARIEDVDFDAPPNEAMRPSPRPRVRFVNVDPPIRALPRPRFGPGKEIPQTPEFGGRRPGIRGGAAASGTPGRRISPLIAAGGFHFGGFGGSMSGGRMGFGGFAR